MTSPRVINPDGIPDDQWWDCEALKLAVMDPKTFHHYTVGRSSGTLAGLHGLHTLGFLKMKSLSSSVGASDWHCVNIYGQYLVDACKRVFKS